MKFELEKVFDIILDNLPKVLFPEELIKLDLAISKMELLALMIVDRHGEVIMSQIAAYINAPLSTTTGLVSRLVSNGYLQRERSDADRRIVTITLTSQGKETVAVLKKRITGYLECVNRSLTEEERDFLFRILMKIAAAFTEPEVHPEKEPVKDVRKIKIE